MVVSPTTLFICLATSFLAGLVNVSLGMGSGFTVTPIFLHLGFSPPQQAVPSVLFSSFVGALLSSYFHHRLGNVASR